MSQPNENSDSPSIHRDNEASTSFASNRESSGAATSSSGSLSVVREEDDRDRRREDGNGFRESEIEQHQQQQEQQLGVNYGGNFFAFDDASVIRDDTWSCVIVVLTFWFFVSMTLILGVYGSSHLTLGPNCSILIQPNSIFVQSIKVQELDGSTNRLTLYAFYKSPSLDVVKNWSKIHNLSVPADSHKELTYFLNEGSQINISYSVNSPGSSVFLVIAQGNEGLVQWLEDPTYPNTTLSWNVIHGSGTIQQDITKSSSYYVAVGNLNSEDVEVQLNLSIRALLYNSTQAYYKCGFSDEVCSTSVLFPNGNTVVLTSPASQQDSSIEEWDVKLSYGPRWATYVAGTAVMTVLMLVVFNFLNNYQCFRGEDSRVPYVEAEPERAPLLSYKDDDLSSWGSSYDSVSNDEEEFEDLFVAGSKDGTSIRDVENGNNTRRLCAICFDAPRDCFFLPCGHCVACFACGTRIAEAAGTCPICRRNIKKVRKIFTV